MLCLCVRSHHVWYAIRPQWPTTNKSYPPAADLWLFQTKSRVRILGAISRASPFLASQMFLSKLLAGEERACGDPPVLILLCHSALRPRCWIPSQARRPLGIFPRPATVIAHTVEHVSRTRAANSLPRDKRGGCCTWWSCQGRIEPCLGRCAKDKTHRHAVLYIQPSSERKRTAGPSVIALSL